MKQRMLAALVIVLVAGSGVGPGHATALLADVTAPKLDSLEQTPVPAPTDSGGVPLPLPRTVTICQDMTGRRCWSEPGDSECRSPAHPSARVFHTVAGEEGDPGSALKACWESLQR